MRRFAIGALCCLVLFGISACTRVSTTSPSGEMNSWTLPHVLRYATGEDIPTLNPALGQQETLGMLSSLTAAWLIKWNRHNLPVPEIATEVPSKANGGISPDGLTITYHLRKGVRWSDGAPLNADDVVWTIHAILNPANNVVSRTGWNLITRIGEPDKYTVVLRLSKPYSPFVVTFLSSAGANPSILPKHILARYPNFNNVPFNGLPVGAGPFMYKAWNRGENVIMVPNPYYFRGRPRLKEVIFEIITDTNTVFTDLQSHALDLWYPTPGSFFVRFKELGHAFSYIRQPGYIYNHIDFNVSRPALRDPIVRHALEYAIDRETILKKIAYGAGSVQEEPASKAAPYYDPSIALVPFDIAKANQLLDADGWRRGADGVREKNGARLDLLVVSSAGDPVADNIIELIQQWWRQIGVAITVRRYEAPQLFNTYQAGGILYGGKWDVSFFAWVDDPIGDFSFIYACDQIPPAGQNDLRWCNPTATAAEHALFAHYDQAQRNADDAIVFAQLAKDTPTVVMYVRDDISIFNRDLKNFHPNNVSPFDDFMNVDI